MSANDRWLTAVHEAGHALVAKLTEGSNPVQKVTIVPHSMQGGSAGGVTVTRPREGDHVTVQHLSAQLDVCMVTLTLTLALALALTQSLSLSLTLTTGAGAAAPPLCLTGGAAAPHQGLAVDHAVELAGAVTSPAHAQGRCNRSRERRAAEPDGSRG